MADFSFFFFLFFFTDPATTEIYTLSYTTLFRSSQLFPLMNFISVSLGVKCGFCHVSQGKDPKTGNTKDRKSTRLNSSHANISYAVFCLKKKNKQKTRRKTLAEQ